MLPTAATRLGHTMHGQVGLHYVSEKRPNFGSLIVFCTGPVRHSRSRHPGPELLLPLPSWSRTTQYCVFGMGSRTCNPRLFRYPARVGRHDVESGAVGGGPAGLPQRSLPLPA